MIARSKNFYYRDSNEKRNYSNPLKCIIYEDCYNRIRHHSGLGRANECLIMNNKSQVIEENNYAARG